MASSGNSPLTFCSHGAWNWLGKTEFLAKWNNVELRVIQLEARLQDEVLSEVLRARFLAGRWGKQGPHSQFHSPQAISLECHGADVGLAERDASCTVGVSGQPTSLAGAAVREDSRDISPGTTGVHWLLRAAPTPAVQGSHTEDPKSHTVACILGQNVQRGY